MIEFDIKINERDILGIRSEEYLILKIKEIIGIDNIRITKISSMPNCNDRSRRFFGHYEILEHQDKLSHV